jgi:PAS domain S-box-containing protein
MSEMRPALDQETLREIVEGTIAETGERFFAALVRHLAQAIGTKCAWVTEWLPDERRLRALSFWVGDDYFGDFEYAIAGTPCEAVIAERCLVFVPERIIELYADDSSLAPLGAVSYMGLPLLDTDGGILGHLAVLDDKPMAEDPRALAIFRIFANRAAAELRRVRRDRDLRERERKLARLIDSAMDAIVELDGEMRITRRNAAAERVFGWADNAVGGIEEFLTRESSGKLAYLTRELARKPEGQQSVWIPDGLEGIRAGGGHFPAEATLSRFELSGRQYFTLILRDVNDRIAAEERIQSLTNATHYLQSEIDALRGFDEIVGDSPALRRTLADVERVASSDTTVLIMGETGTGKELIARAIHRRSPRAAKPLVTVNCAAIPANLQESEFFGHERGAFTGATQRRDGRFKLADGGTLFLDEVGEMSLELQAKLLRVLQEGEYEPVGGSRTVRVDVRVVAATNRDLAAMARAGAFRNDLLYRLDVFPLHVPSLRERGDDVVLLAEAFARKLAQQGGRAAISITPADRARLKAYDWPGNVRELHNVIERALILSTDGRRLNLDRALPESAARAVEALDAPTEAPADPQRVLTLHELQELERRNIERALAAANGKVSGGGGAAEMLGVNPNTLASRMKALGVRRSSPRSRS